MPKKAVLLAAQGDAALYVRRMLQLHLWIRRHTPDCRYNLLSLEAKQIGVIFAFMHETCGASASLTNHPQLSFYLEHIGICTAVRGGCIRWVRVQCTQGRVDPPRTPADLISFNEAAVLQHLQC